MVRGCGRRPEDDFHAKGQLMRCAGPAVGWVGETDPRAQTASPTLDQLSFPAMELYAQQPAATATLH